MKKSRGKELAEEHWKWFSGWVERLEFPMHHKEFVEIVGDAYKDAMEHGYKHGKEDKK